MANKNGNAYGLTLLCPIRPGVAKTCPEGMEGQTNAACVRYLLQDVMRVSEDSPMSLVPNNYLSRFYILSDVPYQGYPTTLEHLKSQYLVFSANFYGGLDDYLTGMWKTVEKDIRGLMHYCYGFEKVHDAPTFIEYIRKCQVETTFFFVGSTDEPLAVQLKNLYLRQEFREFVYQNQGRPAAEIQEAFQAFVARTQPANLNAPTWRAGAYTLENVVVGANAVGAGTK